MNLALDASAAVAFLDDSDGAEVVESALADDEGTAYIHLQNLIEVFYITHRRGALAEFLANNPDRRNLNEPDRPNLDGLDFSDPTVYDVNAGQALAIASLQELAAIGVQTATAMDAELWQDAARLKSQFRRVSLADCFGVALAPFKRRISDRRPPRTRSLGRGGRSEFYLYLLK